MHSRQEHESSYHDLLSFVESAQRDQNGPVIIHETAFGGELLNIKSPAEIMCNIERFLL